LLSNKFFIKALLSFVLLFPFISCSDKEEKIPLIDYQNKVQLLEIVKKHYNKDVQFAFGGAFDESGKNEIAVGREIENYDDWGIKFILLEKSGDDFDTKYESDLLDGSFKESFIDKIKFASFDYELLYYNSQNYFIGSGGGEIFAYIVDYENKQIYYAHLVVESAKPASLYISDNSENREIRNFFTLNFKRDYPDLKLVDDDIIID
jgi:hypothetical protein